MKKHRKLPVYHIGDLVKIIKPEIFIRCGYPKTKKDFSVTLEERERIRGLLESLGIENNDFLYYRYDNGLNKICDEISYLRLAKAGFGGNSREIHTTQDFNLLNIVGKVMSKRIVKTGVYDYGFIDYSGDSNPPYLKNEESHVILTLDIHNSYSSLIPYIMVEIEEKNVEKI